MAAGLHNPYRDPRGQWIRGNFHGHCSEHSGCATVPLAEGVRRFRDVGTRFMAVTDHDHVTELAALRATCPDMVFLDGFEHSASEHLAFVGESVDPLHQFPLDEALRRADGLLTLACHPQPDGEESDYWTRDKLVALGTWPDGIEVYNGHYGLEAALSRGRWPRYTEFWDELLTAGHWLWGFANDDFHDLEDLGNAFNMVLVEEVTAAAIVRAAKRGRCYASTGLLLHEVNEAAGHIVVDVETSCAGVFIGPGGQALGGGEGTHFEHAVGGEAYVRFQAEGDTGLLFLQPMFRQSSGP